MGVDVLIVDDEVGARHGMRRALEKEGYRIEEAGTILEARRGVELINPSVVLLDVKLAGESGLDYLPELTARRIPPAVIVVTAHGSIRTAIEAIKKGAFDFLPKPFDVDELRILIRNAAESYRLRMENVALRTQLAGAESYGELIGASPEMRTVFGFIDKVGPAQVAVLITGESGTGKELVAREIHARSAVREGPFIAVNCAALPDELIESELFGHEKGAFTGAANRRIGKFEAASGGTIFLDEIGDTSPSTQAKLLRVLEAKTFERLGSNTTISTNARVISATNKDLAASVREGSFRDDLYYRLSVVTVRVPALRERPADIALLAEVFCDRYSALHRAAPISFSKAALKKLLEYSWRGNVRQLRNEIERAVILAETATIEPELLLQDYELKPNENQDIATSQDISVSTALDFRAAKREFERKYIEKCLELTSGNITAAAARLGIHRQSLQHKIRELGLTKKFI